MPKNKENLFIVIAIFIGIFTALLVLEIFLRYAGLGYGRSGHVADPYLHHVNPQSFEFVAHSPAGEFKSFKVQYNEYGFRQRNMENAKKANLKLALLGDSYTLSRELPYDETFAGVLESNCADISAVFNYGVASYSPIIYLVQWQRIIQKSAPTHVLVQLYTNDADDDKDYLRYAKYSPEGEIISIPGPSSIEMILKKWVMNSYVIRYVFKTSLQLKWLLLHSDEFGNNVGGYIEPNPEIPEISKKCILQLAKNVKATNAEFMITVIPSKCRIQGQSCDTTRADFSERWRQWADSNDIRFLDLTESFTSAIQKGVKPFFERDIHFNEHGSRIVAEQIMNTWPELFQNDKNRGRLPGSLQSLQ